MHKYLNKPKELPYQSETNQLKTELGYKNQNSKYKIMFLESIYNRSDDKYIYSRLSFHNLLSLTSFTTQPDNRLSLGNEFYRVNSRQNLKLL